MRKFSHLFAIALCWTLFVDQPERIIDGDTYVAKFNLWLGSEKGTYVSVVERVRVLGVDAVESSSPNGPAATAFTTAWLQKGPFTVTACNRDAFGRILGHTYRGNEVLAEEIIKAGFSKEGSKWNK